MNGKVSAFRRGLLVVLEFAPWHRYAVIGMTQSGKTTFVKKALLPAISNIVIVDPKRHMGDLGQVVRTVGELRAAVLSGQRRVVLQPDVIDDLVLQQVCDFIFRHLQNTMLFIDELQLFCSSRSIPSALMSIATAGEGLPLRLGLTVALQSASDIHPHIKRNLTHVVSFKQFLRADVDYLVQNFGDGFDGIRDLLPYWSLYWNSRSGAVVKLRPLQL